MAGVAIGRPSVAGEKKKLDKDCSLHLNTHRPCGHMHTHTQWLSTRP